MAFHDDLLEQAIHLAHLDPLHPKQASLRRAISTAYYALFHLLIDAAVSNWGRHNPGLARAFDHRTMKITSLRLLSPIEFPFTGEDPDVVVRLRSVAKSFVELQENRHLADYDNSTTWIATDALTLVKSAELAFARWHIIRQKPIAQDYLVALLFKNRS